ncbi:ATP-binding protein [Flavobacterium sp.]|uniref:ATP-binding protein n=1 Tax=Flavobacterium sp. TaxID=239 RepID=UPI0039E2C0EA
MLRRTYTLLFLFVVSFSVFATNTETDSIDIYINQKQESKALKYGIRRETELRKSKNYKALCINNIKTARIYIKFNDSEKSINLLFATLKIAEKQKLAFEQVLILNEIGKNFQFSLNRKKSLRYFKQGEKIAQQLKNDTLVAFMEQGLFHNYVFLQEKDSAKMYMTNIMRIHRNKGNYDQVYRCYSNYSVYHFSFDKSELGKKYLDTAIYYAKKNNKIAYLITCYMNLGYYYLTSGNDLKKGEQQYLKILALNPKDTTSIDATDCYLNLSYAYENMGDYKKAIKYLNKYVDNTAMIFEDKINSQLKDAETKYEIEKVESEYKIKQSELEELQSKRQKIFIIVIALLIVIAILFYFFNQNTRLKEKNKLKDIESKLQQDILNATLDGQENERKKIASVLHDSISAQLSSAGLHLSAFAATHANSEEIAKTRAILKEAHDKVRDLSHELLPTLLAKFGLLYALRDLCEKNSNSLIEFEYTSNIPDKKRFSEEFEMKVYFITTELLNNILKHSQADEASLTLIESNNQLHITIEDNGKGFEGGKNRSSEGFGLTQIRARIKNMKGQFTIDSKPGNGTTITITIPLES